MRPGVDVVRRPVGGTDHDGGATGQRLGHGAAEVLVLARLHQHRGLPEQGDDLPPRDGGRVRHAIGARVGVEQRKLVGGVPGTADDAQSSVGDLVEDEGEGVEEEVEALPRVQTAEAEDGRRPVPVATRGGAERLEVHRVREGGEPLDRDPRSGQLGPGPPAAADHPVAVPQHRAVEERVGSVVGRKGRVEEPPARPDDLRPQASDGRQLGLERSLEPGDGGDAVDDERRWCAQAEHGVVSRPPVLRRRQGSVASSPGSPHGGGQRPVGQALAPLGEGAEEGRRRDAQVPEPLASEAGRGGHVLPVGEEVDGHAPPEQLGQDQVVGRGEAPRLLVDPPVARQPEPGGARGHGGDATGSARTADGSGMHRSDAP